MPLKAAERFKPAIPSALPARPARTMSSRACDSTRITSAPKLPSQALQWGTERIQPKSMTRKPCRGRFSAIDAPPERPRTKPSDRRRRREPGQLGQLRPAEAKQAAEDFFIVLAQERRRSPQPPGRARQPHKRPRLCDRAGNRMLLIDEGAAGAVVRRGDDLGR